MSKVLVNFIQDRSGSMQSVWHETLSGFKAFVKDLQDKGKRDGVEYLFSLTTFDTEIETPIVAKPIVDVLEDALVAHGPRGCTALYDAVGETIRNTENGQAVDKIVVVVATDGHENSSRGWDKDKLHKAIEEKLNLGNWTFTYLGTQPETWDDAAGIGISLGSVATYVPQQAKAAYRVTSAAVHAMSMSNKPSSRNLVNDYVPDAVAASAGMTKHTGSMPSSPVPRTNRLKHSRTRRRR